MKADRFAQVLHFAEVSRVGSFSVAAAKLGVSVSSVSRHVAHLESRLGVRLLQRTTRAVKLTEAGHDYLRRCESLLDELDAADAAADDGTANLRGRLRLSVPGGLSDTVIMPALAVFMATHPDLQVELLVGNRYVDLIDEGYDLAIRVGQPSSDGLVVRRIGQNVRLLVASPVYVERRGRPLHPDDLGRHAALQLANAAPSLPWQFTRRGEEIKVIPRGPLLCNHAPALRQAALAGLGVTVLPNTLVAGDLREGSLLRLLPKWHLPVQPINAVFPSGRYIPNKVRALADHLKAALNQPMDP